MKRLVGIYRYPVKGLSAEALLNVHVEAHGCIPYDRAWAIENAPGRFNPEAPKHLPKVAFLMLMRDERLASLQTAFDERTETLTIFRAGKVVAKGALSTRPGRLILEQFFAAFMEESLRGPPKIVSAPGHAFTDIAPKRVHVINLASVRDLERAADRPINPLRFRPNLVIDGPEPWAELSWLGKEISIGSIRLKIRKATDRCAATNVDPETGLRNMDVPALISRHRGHTDFGVYAEIMGSGELKVGESLLMDAA